MKKLLIFLFSVSLSFTIIFNAFGCGEQDDPIYQRVSELKNQVFVGQSANYNLKACYGFKEQPYLNDAKVGEKFSLLTFKLLDKQTDSATYTLTLNFNGKDYKQDFKPSKITGTLTVEFNIDNFNLTQFDVTITSGSSVDKVQLNSVVPKNAITYKQALDYLRKDQAKLIDSLTDANGNLNFEIYARIIVKNDKPYWYIGLGLGDGKLKALLIDGFSGQILAVREVI